MYIIEIIIPLCIALSACGIALYIKVYKRSKIKATIENELGLIVSDEDCFLHSFFTNDFLLAKKEGLTIRYKNQISKIGWNDVKTVEYIFPFPCLTINGISLKTLILSNRYYKAKKFIIKMKSLSPNNTNTIFLYLGCSI